MRRRVKRGLLVAAVLVVILGASGFAYHRYRYPYGWSHSCDKQLAMILLQHAEQHDGWFPRGEESPEASLSLLSRDDPMLVELLRGKTAPVEAVRERLASGQLLTPDTCGWHYVEGLRKDDDPKLALFWDKIGLGHNGERLENGGHNVGFVNGEARFVSGGEWDAFLEDQARLRAAIKRK